MLVINYVGKSVSIVNYCQIQYLALSVTDLMRRAHARYLRKFIPILGRTERDFEECRLYRTEGDFEECRLYRTDRDLAGELLEEFY